MKGILEDLKHALRIYWRTPGASLMVVAVLAIGMAFVAAFLSLYSDLILRPEPGFERGGRIVSVGWGDGRNAGGLPLELYDRIEGASTTLEHVAGVTPQQFRFGTEKEQLFGELVTSQFFPGIRPKMVLGRGFTAAEHDAEGEPVVVISWRYWQEKFAGLNDVIGQTVQIEGPQNRVPQGMAQQGAQPELPKDFRIVGVMSREYVGTLPPQAQQQARFWIPVERGFPMMFAGMPAQFMTSVKRSYTLRGIGRLASGARSVAAARELNGRFADEEFIKRPGAKYEVIDRIVQNIFIQRETERQLQLFLGASVLLALVAAANVSLFLLARAPGRRRELGIRMAVGAPLRRLARQLASEAAVLVLAGAVLGLGLSIWLAQYLRGLPFLRQAQWRDVTLLDGRVLGLVGVFLLVVTLLVSLAPILGLKRLGIAASSRQVAARATVAQRIAGTAQIAVAGALGGAAIAFAWHLVSMLVADPGYRRDNLYAVTYTMATAGRTISFRGDSSGRIIVEGLVDNARKQEAFGAVPGVTAVSLAAAVPGVPANTSQSTVADPRDPQQSIRVRSVMIDSHYVDLLGLRLLYGRNVTDSEPGVLVNQAYARRFFGREDVVGEPVPNLQMSGGQVPGLSVAGTPITGVVEDISYEHPLADIDPTMFTTSGIPIRGLALIESTRTAAALQKEFQEVARVLNLTVDGNVVSLARARSDLLAPDRARGFLTIATAILVVLLAAFGFYGTQRYLVTAGRREYAIRASLGAGPRALGRLVLKRGLLLGLPGLVLGVPAAFILVAWLRDDYISRAISPLAVSAAIALGLAALLVAASLGPARLARRTQPAPLLRED